MWKWTCGYDKTLKLSNLPGELMESLQRQLKTMSWDITVTNSGNIVFELLSEDVIFPEVSL